MYVLNESTVFERLNIEGIIVNLSPSDTIDCKGMALKVRKCTVVDEGGSIPLSLYADLLSGKVPPGKFAPGKLPPWKTPPRKSPPWGLGLELGVVTLVTLTLVTLTLVTLTLVALTPGGTFPRGTFPRGDISRGDFSGGNFPGGTFPRTADLTDVVTEKLCYKLTNMVVHKYKSTRLLKITERTTITLSTDQKITVDVQDFVDETKKTVEATVISIKLDSFKKSVMCPNCKAPIDDDFAEGSSCESMMSTDDCPTTSKIIFTIKDKTTKERVEVSAKHEIIESFYGESISSKREIAKLMLKTGILVTYDVAEETVISLEALKKVAMDIDETEKNVEHEVS